jgi:hypothetical protein
MEDLEFESWVDDEDKRASYILSGQWSLNIGFFVAYGMGINRLVRNKMCSCNIRGIVNRFEKMKGS